MFQTIWLRIIILSVQIYISEIQLLERSLSSQQKLANLLEISAQSVEQSRTCELQDQKRACTFLNFKADFSNQNEDFESNLFRISYMRVSFKLWFQKMF
jgi:hypothetical protein